MLKSPLVCDRITFSFLIQFNCSMSNSSDVLMKSWKEEEFKDFTFKVQGTKIKAHQWLLASMSPVFKKMFTVDMAENSLKETAISDFSSYNFSLFLSLFYGYKITFVQNLTTGINLYRLCHLYEVDQLKPLCIDFIVSKAYISNLEELLDFNAVFDIPAVKEAANRILKHGPITNVNAVRFLQIAEKTNDVTVKYRVFAYICETQIRVQEISNWDQITKEVGDELHGCTLDWMAPKLKDLRRLEMEAFKSNKDKLRKKKLLVPRTTGDRNVEILCRGTTVSTPCRFYQ